LLSNQRHQQTSWEQKIFNETALRLATACGFDCEFGERDWQAVLRADDEVLVSFDLCCPDLGFSETVAVPREEFEAVAREVRDLE
jgi:hypothetical protein